MEVTKKFKVLEQFIIIMAHDPEGHKYQQACFRILDKVHGTIDPLLVLNKEQRAKQEENENKNI